MKSWNKPIRPGVMRLKAAIIKSIRKKIASCAIIKASVEQLTQAAEILGIEIEK